MMPPFPKILATTALCLVAAGICVSCHQTKEVMPDRFGCYLTYSRGVNHISSPEMPSVYRLNADESRELGAIEDMGKADSVNLYYVPPEDYPIFLIYSWQGEPRTLTYESRFKSHTDIFLPPAAAARFDALVQKIQSRPGAQLQGAELRDWYGINSARIESANAAIKRIMSRSCGLGDVISF